MSKKSLARLENLIGAILCGIGCWIAMIDEKFTYRWVIGFALLITPFTDWEFQRGKINGLSKKP